MSFPFASSVCAPPRLSKKRLPQPFVICVIQVVLLASAADALSNQPKGFTPVEAAILSKKRLLAGNYPGLFISGLFS